MMHKTTVPTAVLIVGLIATILVVGLASVEIVFSVLNRNMPIEIRQWTLTAAVVCSVIGGWWTRPVPTAPRRSADTLDEERVQHLVDVTAEALAERIRPIIREELHYLLTRERLATAVQEVVLPALDDLTNYQTTRATRPHLATVTRLNNDH